MKITRLSYLFNKTKKENQVISLSRDMIILSFETSKKKVVNIFCFKTALLAMVPNFKLHP